MINKNVCIVIYTLPEDINAAHFLLLKNDPNVLHEYHGTDYST